MKYEPNWKSLKQYRTPQWFKDAKLGIFIHYGLFSVPGQGCLYGNGMYIHDHPWFKSHIENHGPQYDFGYKDFIPMFKAENFNPDEWVDLFAKAGARYIVPVADFHDAFPMYDSDLTEWTAVKMGPKRDIIGELKTAVEKHGLKFGVSSHLASNWKFFPHDPEYDTSKPEYAEAYGYPHGEVIPKSHLERWYARTIELIDKYQPDKLWFDFGIERPEFIPYRPEVAAYYYNKAMEWGKEVVLTYKNEDFEEGTAVLDFERGLSDDISPMCWQTDTSIGKLDWSYKINEEYKSAQMLINEFVDIVSKNGCLLLNVGPKPDGTIPREQIDVLMAFGDWLRVNGEAIYGTRPWVKFGEGPTKMVSGQKKESENCGKRYTSRDIRFTTKDDTLYAIFLDWPGAGKTTIHSLCGGNIFLGRQTESVQMLGHDGDLKWKHDEYGLTVDIPDAKPCDYSYVIKINIE